MYSVKSPGFRAIAGNIRALAAGHWPALAIAVCALGLEFGGDAWRVAVRFDRIGLASGELWRLVTGQLVHLGWSHLLLNLAGLAVLSVLFGTGVSRRRFLWYFVGGVAGVNAGLWFVATDIEWYVGLSGALHGIWAGGAGDSIRRGDRRFGVAVGALLVLKLVIEQVMGPLPLTEGISGGTVVQIAHLFGATGGLIAAVPVLLRSGDRDRGAKPRL